MVCLLDCKISKTLRTIQATFGISKPYLDEVYRLLGIQRGPQVTSNSDMCHKSSFEVVLLLVSIQLLAHDESAE